MGRTTTGLPFYVPSPKGPAVFLFILLTGFSSPGSRAQAQAVEGRVLDRERGEPVQGAMVVLLSGEDEVHSGFLTDEEGRFSLRAPGTGRFMVRAERIGFSSVTVQVEVKGREPLSLEILTEPIPLFLEGLIISGSGRCLIRPEEGLEVARVWEEARKALANQEMTSGGGLLRHEVVRYRKELDISGKEVGEVDRAKAVLVTRTPIRSLPAEDLSAEGYVRKSPDGGYEYLGPDASVLLSDAFLDTHCFRLVEDPDAPSLIGLAFEPINGRRIPDISGTFWLNRESGLLTLLTYRYSWTPWSEAQGAAGGRVEFEELPTGAWVIRRWHIRMPIMVLDRSIRALGGDGLRVEGFREEGGEVTNVSFLRGGRIVDNVSVVTVETDPAAERK